MQHCPFLVFVFFSSLSSPVKDEGDILSDKFSVLVPSITTRVPFNCTIVHFFCFCFLQYSIISILSGMKVMCPLISSAFTLFSTSKGL